MFRGLSSPAISRPQLHSQRHVGYPVVLKRGYGSAGDNVAICSNQTELAYAFSTTRIPESDIDSAESGRVLVQAHIPGITQYYSVAAWKGKLLAGFANG